MSNMTKAAQDVLAERRRQIEAEGWTPEHDDAYGGPDLAAAAACYAIGSDEIAYKGRPLWPWKENWWKPSGYRRDLVKAGALILAEIERLDRAHGIGGSDDQAEPKREPRVKPTHEAADAFWRYWHEQAEPQCRCRACLALLAEPVVEFTVCPQCGNKRCPKADDHRNACTGSNEPGQVAQAADRGLRANLLQRDREQLERTNRLLRESLADVIKLLDHAPPRTPADDEIIRRATRALTLGSLL